MKGSFSKATYTSDWAADIYGRTRSDTKAAWNLLGVTPGQVQVPLEMVIKIVPHMGSQDIPAWISEVKPSDQLISVDFRSPIDDGVMQAMCDLPTLTELLVDDASSLTDQGASHLTCLRRLTTLSLGNAGKLTQTGFEQIGKILSMKSLSLSHLTVLDIAFRELVTLSLLESLVLRACRALDGSGTRYLRGLGNLRSIDFTGNSSLTAAALDPLRFVRSVRRLILANCGAITGDIHDVLMPLVQLRCVDLSHNDKLGDKPVAALQHSPDLSTLSLAHTAISNNGVRLLRDVLSLRSLDLSGCSEIDDRSIKHIMAMRRLVHINLSFCPNIRQRTVNRLRNRRPRLHVDAEGLEN